MKKKGAVRQGSAPEGVAEAGRALENKPKGKGGCGLERIDSVGRERGGGLDWEGQARWVINKRKVRCGEAGCGWRRVGMNEQKKGVGGGLRRLVMMRIGMGRNKQKKGAVRRGLRGQGWVRAGMNKQKKGVVWFGEARAAAVGVGNKQKKWFGLA